MRVLVTGGTGFVGSHCVRALLGAGHDVKLLVRDPARIPKALEPLGVPGEHCDVVVGDVLHEDTVRRGLADVDAVLHAANVYSLNAGHEALLQRVNVDGTRQILHAAVDAGLDPVVHVSSTTALLPSEHPTHESPIGDPYGPYERSKAAAESVARDLQAAAPVVITNPAAVIGPHDPHMGETTANVRDMLRPSGRVAFDGGIGWVDARDVAAAHAALLTPGMGPRRYLMAGQWVSLPEAFDHMSEVTGRRLRPLRIPRRAAFGFGRLNDAAQRRGVDPGFGSAALVWVLSNHPRFDDSRTRRELGVEWRPVEDSLRDTVAWLHERGEVTTRQAGRAAHASWSEGDTVGSPWSNR